MVQIERHLDRLMAQVTFMSNLGTDQRLNIKMAYAAIHRPNLKWYISLPPMYYYFGKGYKTPLNTEIRFKEKVVFNLDVYTDVPVFSIQFKQRF
jgi:small-conductance mechanosensitive channel